MAPLRKTRDHRTTMTNHDERPTRLPSTSSPIACPRCRSPRRPAVRVAQGDRVQPHPSAPFELSPMPFEGSTPATPDPSTHHRTHCKPTARRFPRAQPRDDIETAPERASNTSMPPAAALAALQDSDGRCLQNALFQTPTSPKTKLAATPCSFASQPSRFDGTMRPNLGDAITRRLEPSNAATKITTGIRSVPRPTSTTIPISSHPRSFQPTSTSCHARARRRPEALDGPTRSA